MKLDLSNPEHKILWETAVSVWESEQWRAEKRRLYTRSFREVLEEVVKAWKEVEVES